MATEAKTTSVETLAPEIDKMIEGAKQAVQYFQWMVDGQKATAVLIQSQLDYATEQLNQLVKDKENRYGKPTD